MRVFLINLARRPDRLRNMLAQLADLDIATQRVNAIDAKHTSDAVADRNFSAGGPLGPIPKGDKCCTLSHMRAWRAFLASGNSHGLILEDDVALDPQGVALLHDAGWIPPSVGLLKIEHYGPENQRVLLDGMIDAGCGRQIGRLRSRHTGAAAYIISRRTAQQLLSWPGPWTLPVDHMLFNPNNSPLTESLRPYQLTPAMARQSEAIGGATDIDQWREQMRGLSWRYVRREMVRAYYDLRLLPSQVASFATHEAALVRVEASPTH
jgi:glycosyl transferase family 25